jgi:ferritin-like protein
VQPENNDVTGSVDACARNLYTPYNPKDMKQCVAVCIACERGVVTTCSTSCTLKGAR